MDVYIITPWKIHILEPKNGGGWKKEQTHLKQTKVYIFDIFVLVSSGIRLLPLFRLINRGHASKTKPCPGSPVNQTKWLVFRMIHGFRIPDPTKGQSLVDLDFLGL